VSAFRTTRRRVATTIAAAAVVAGGAFGIASAAGSHTPTNARAHARGINEFGMTGAYYKGTRVRFTYTRGFWCDRSVPSAASTGCEAGAPYHHAPAAQHDPLYVTVPLGFDRPMTDCPAGLICVDHPGTIDLSRLEPALKPLYPQLTDAQLRQALKNAPLPNHDHFITDPNWRKPEWWDVQVVGVTSAKTYKNIVARESYGYIAHLLKNHNKNVVGPVPTNLFLYFSAK
jgi:hypothetical protein